MKWRDESGVTLVELTVILAIAGVLAASVYTSLGNVLQVTESKGAAEQVAASVRLARQYAITRGQNHCIQFSGSPNTSFQIRTAPDNTNCIGAIVQSLTTIGHGLAIINPTNLSIIFDGIGNVKNFAGNPSVTMAVDTSPHSCTYNVLVTLYGGVRVGPGSC